MFNNAAGYDLVTGENPVNSQFSNGVCFIKNINIKDSEPQCTVLTVLSKSPSSARGSEGGSLESVSLVSVPHPLPGGGIDGPRWIGSPAQSRFQNPE